MRSAMPGGRNTAARVARSLASAICMKRSTAATQAGSGTQPARRNISQGVRVLAAASFSRAPIGSWRL